MAHTERPLKRHPNHTRRKRTSGGVKLQTVYEKTIESHHIKERRFITAARHIQALHNRTQGPSAPQAATEHFASVFQSIRRHFNVHEAFVAEMCKPMDGESHDKQWDLKGAGKSGSLLYFCPSKQFIIKSLPVDEFHKLRHHIFAYHQHMVERPTLLTRLCALYEVHSHYYVAMVNAFWAPSIAPSTAYKDYDIKGSWEGRVRKGNETTHKDQDWMHDQHSHINDQWRAKALSYTGMGTSATSPDIYAERFVDFMDTCVVPKMNVASTLQDIILYDVGFLKETMKVMDYSLLIRTPAHAPPDTPVVDTDPEPTIHKQAVIHFAHTHTFVSLIDFLAGYGVGKQLQARRKHAQATFQHPAKAAAPPPTATQTTRL